MPRPDDLQRYEALLHEDLVVPVHHHDDRRDCLVTHVNGYAQPLTPEQAGALVAEKAPTPELTEVDHDPDGPRAVKRRHVLGGMAAGFGGLLAASHLPRYSFAAPMPPAEPRAAGNGQLVVVIFLRGGIDGLQAVVPTGDPAYYRARPTIGVRNVIDLGGGWGLNANMRALKPLWDDGSLVALHGLGHPRLTRSHFDDEFLVEQAAPANTRTGWLGRHLQSSSTSQGTFRGVSIGNRTTYSLTTSTLPTIAMSSIAQFELEDWQGYRQPVKDALAGMYARAGGDAAVTATSVFRAIGELSTERSKGDTNTTGYPDHDFGRGMAEIARLAKANLGLEVACIDHIDWDMHVDLGRGDDAQGWFSRQSRVLAEGIAALRRDLGTLWQRTTVITVSEFGRVVKQNGSGGTDHGSGNLMLIAGGGLKGRRVISSINGLGDDRLDRGGVRIGLDYRQPLAEIVSKRLGNTRLDQVFPGFTPGPMLGIV